MFHKAAITIFGTIFITLVTSINLVALARILGPTVMGQYTYAIWLINISVIVATMGIPNLLYKYIPEINHKLDVLHGRFLFFVLFAFSTSLSLLVGGFIAFLFPVFKSDAGYGLYMDIIALSIPLVVYSTLIGAYFKGRLKFSLIYIFNTGYALALSIATLVPAIVTHSIDPVLIGFLITNILYFIFLTAVIIKLVGIGNLLHYARHLRYYLGNKKTYQALGSKEIIYYLLSASFILVLDTVVWDRSEVFFLKHFAGDAQVAYYSIDLSVVQKILSLIPSATNGFLLSYFALFNVQSAEKEIQEILYNASKLLIIISVPIACCGAVIASSLIGYILGPTYVGAVGTLRVLFFFGLWGPITTPILILLYGLRRIRIIMAFGLIFTIVTLILDYFLIKEFSSIGGAIANSAVQLGFAICLFVYLNKVLHKRYPYMILLKSFAISLPVAGLLWLFTTRFTSFLALIIAIILGTILYFLGIGYAKVFEKNDVKYLNKFIPNKVLQNLLYKILRTGYAEFEA